MHLRPLLLIAVILFIASCTSSVRSPDKSPRANFPAEKIMGTYSGSFDKGLIRIVINYASNGHLSGFNIHKGRRRNMNGHLQQAGGLVSIKLKEPGDDPFDGVFNLFLDSSQESLTGTWNALDSNKIKSKKIALKRIPEEELKEEKLNNDVWATAYGMDSVLTFSSNSTCTLEFYPNPGDSLSQLVTIRGNFSKNDDSYTIEWEKNTILPAQIMKLNIITTKHVDGTGDEFVDYRLKGGGLTFIKYDF